jgi:hypothetical protein
VARTPQEVFAHHVAAIGACDPDAIAADHAVRTTPEHTKGSQ